MPVELNIIESVTTLDTTIVTVELVSASEPGPAGPGVPTGGTAGQVLTKDSGTDYDTSWQDATGGGGGAPTDATYLVTTANGTLTDEVVVGATPGGELGGTWASPTVDASHSGSTHAAVQAAAEATASAALTAHESDTTGIHGIADTANLYSVGGTDVAIADGGTGASTAAGARANLDLEAGTDFPALSTFNDHSARHEDGGADEIDLTGLSGVPAALTTHEADTTSVHGIADTSALALTANHPSNATFNDHSARHENGGADEISLAGLSGTSEALQAHLDDTADAHDASAVSVADSGGNYTATDVEGVLTEIASQLGGGTPDVHYETRSSNTILGVADKGKVIDITAAITQTFEADETLGDGWHVILRNATDDGTTVVVLNPAGSETIDGLTTVTMYSGEARLIMCNGSGNNFNSLLLAGGYARFTADGNFIVPHGISQITVDAVGGGGGGGGGRGAAAGGVRKGGGGGGGGARVHNEFDAAVLGNPGDTIAVDVGAGGTPGGGGSSANGTAGGAGASTTFGSLLTAYGGGGGALGDNGTGTNHSHGGSGGGFGEVGQAGVVGSAGVRGGSNPYAPTASIGYGYGGAGGGSALPSEWGGGGGGAAQSTGAAPLSSGQNSMMGGAGGGAGGGLVTGNTETAGTAGGSVGVYSASGGGGGTAGPVNGGAGGAGADGNSRIGGQGGGGGGSQDSGTGGAGGNGGAAGGGAGGGGGGTSTGGAGGTGGRGECRVWYQ